MVAALGGRTTGGVTKFDPAQLRKRFEARDANKNGTLEGDEIPEQLRSFVGLIDANSDGALTPAELGQGLRALLAPARPRDREKAEDAAAKKPAIELSLVDLDGRTWHPLRPAAGNQAQVLFFITGDCPVANQYSPEIGRIARL